MDCLKQCAPAFLTHPDAIDLLIDFIPEIESFRGKGGQRMNEELPQILQSTLFEYRYQFSASKKTRNPIPMPPPFRPFTKSPVSPFSGR